MRDTDASDRRRGAVADRIRILIVDDHALFRVGMANILGREKDFEIIGEADSSRSAIEAAEQLSPDVILMDASLPSPGGIETTQRIRRELPATAIVVMAADEDEEALFASIKAGAAAFAIKDIS
ncbi:MAG TPA: response regulator transcription factor, partial [Candidatus Limnocylindrales bacterium]|nr:response regulator transcription factor [Candidatus Limnocylindrales bacterium]